MNLYDSGIRPSPRPAENAVRKIILRLLVNHSTVLTVSGPVTAPNSVICGHSAACLADSHKTSSCPFIYYSSNITSAKPTDKPAAKSYSGAARAREVAVAAREAEEDTSKAKRKEDERVRRKERARREKERARKEKDRKEKERKEEKDRKEKERKQERRERKEKEHEEKDLEDRRERDKRKSDKHYDRIYKDSDDYRRGGRDGRDRYHSSRSVSRSLFPSPPRA